MIANVSPALFCCEPTLNTLRYADRVKELKKDPALKDKADDLMLARQGKNTKIIELDQKTGKPVSEMAELDADFQLVAKKKDPSEKPKSLRPPQPGKNKKERSVSDPRGGDSSHDLSNSPRQRTVSTNDAALQRQRTTANELKQGRSGIQRPASSNRRPDRGAIGGGIGKGTNKIGGGLK